MPEQRQGMKNQLRPRGDVVTTKLILLARQRARGKYIARRRRRRSIFRFAFARENIAIPSVKINHDKAVFARRRQPPCRYINVERRHAAAEPRDSRSRARVTRLAAQFTERLICWFAARSDVVYVLEGTSSRSSMNVCRIRHGTS